MISFSNWVSRDIIVHQLPIRPLPAKIHYFVAIPHVRRLLATIHPDVVLAYYVTGYGTMAALTGFHPLVQVTSGSDVLVVSKNSAMKFLLGFTLKWADLVTAWESHMAEAAQLLGAPKERIFILPRGIPYEQFRNTRSSQPVPTSTVAIISTRSLGANYNIDRLVKAAHILLQSGVDCSFTIAGDGPCRDLIVNLANQLGVNGRVRFAGFVPNDRLSGLLRQHNFYISLIKSDGVSASLLEAMAAGLLPIVPDHAANRLWIRHGENGILLQDLSPTGITQGIRLAISDLPLRRRAWDANPEIVRERADLYRNSELYVKKFRELAQRKKRMPGFIM
jgi:glycosyltransferase involved in cell wall biosynthesis